MKKFLFIIICFVAGIAIINGCDNDIVQVNPYDPESENTIIGGINGAVSPASSNALISAKRGTIIYASTRIDLNGHFFLQNLPQGLYTLIVEANNFFTDSSNTNIQVTARTETSLGTIYLNSSTHGSISGIVEPYSENTLVKLNKNNILIDSVRVDEISKFTFTMLDPGIYGLEVSLSGYSDYSIDNIRVNAGTTTVLDTIVMSSIYGSIIGVVEPYNENTLVKLSQDDNLIDSTRVDEASEFSFTMLDGGTYGIEITLTGYSTYSNNDVIVSSGAITNLGTIILNDISKGSITGIISPKSSQAVVSLMQGDTNIDATVIDPLTGQYIFTNLDPGTHDIYISAEGYADASITGIEVIAGETNENNNYILEETGMITGIVYPVNSNAMVTAIKDRQATAENRINPVDGSYRLRNLIPGYYNLNVSAEGWISEVSYEMIRVDAGATISLERIYLAQNGSNVIYGRITDENSGNALTGANVELAGNSNETDIEGYFTFSNVPSGLRNMSVRKTGYLTTVTQINIPSTGCSSNNITLTPSGSLSGFIRDSISGNGIVNVRISIDNDDFVTFSEANGYYSFEHLPAGNHSISYTKDGYNPTNEQIIIIMGLASSLDISLEPFSSNRGSLRGRVRNFYTNANIADATIIVAGMMGSSNDQGWYRIDFIPIGNQVAIIEHIDYIRQTEQVSIHANSDAELNFALVPKDSLNVRATGTLTGTLRDDDTGAIIDYSGNLTIYLTYDYLAFDPFPLYNNGITDNGNFQIFNMIYDSGNNPNYDSPNIPIGVYHLWAQEFYTSNIGTYGYKGFDLLVEVQEGDNHVNVRLGQLCSIGGIISDAVSEESVERVRVLGVLSDENGVYYGNHVDPEVTKITTSKDGYYNEDFDVTLISGQHNNVELYITPLPKVRGTIRNGANGQVLNGVEVSSSRAETTTSNDAGIYEIQFNNNGQSSLNFAKPGFHNHTIFLDIPRTGTTTIDVELMPN